MMFTDLRVGGGVSSLSQSENLDSVPKFSFRAVRFLLDLGVLRQDFLGVPSLRRRFLRVNGDRNSGATLHSDGRVGLYTRTPIRQKLPLLIFMLDRFFRCQTWSL